MKKLLLTSQGLQPELKEVFLSLLNKPAYEVSVSFITTAAYGDSDNPKWLEIYRNQLRDVGITKIEDLDLKNKSQQELEKILAKKDIVFVNGGNAFYLLYYIKQSGFDKLLPKLLDQGKLYLGISAGSYVVCPVIEQTMWKFHHKNIVGLKDFTGMNLVPFIITAHFEEKNRTTIQKNAKLTKYPLVAINDKQAILVEDDKYKLIGSNEREFFSGFRENWV